LFDAMPGLPVPFRRERLRQALPFLALTLAIFALDQVTKGLVAAGLEVGESFPREGLVKLTHVTNTGAAFGILRDQSAFLTFTGVLALAVLFLYLWHPGQRRPLFQVALALLLGGAAGNLADRLRLGYVIDFIDLPRWPAFNIADSAIVTGIALLALLLALGGEREAQHG